MDKWKMLIAAVAASGFTGSSLADLKSWTFQEGVEQIKLKNGETVKVEDLDDVYAKRKKITLTIDDEEGEDQIVDNRSGASDDDELDDDGNPIPKNRRADRRKRQQLQDDGWGAGSGGSDDSREDKARTKIRGGNSAERLRNLQECKRYNSLAANAKTVYSDSDVAEAHGAKRRFEMAGTRDYEMKSRDKEIVDYWTKAGGVYDGVLGGVLIPETYDTQLIDVTPGFGTAREAAGGVYPMETQKQFIPRLGKSVKFGLVAEGVESPTTAPEFDGVHMDAREISGLIVMPTRLLRQSAISITDFLAGNIENSKRHYEDLAYWRGINQYTNTVEWEGVEQKLGSNTISTVTGLSSLVGLTLTDLLEWTATLPDEADQFESDTAIYCHRSVDELTFQRFVGTSGGAQETDITQKPRRSFNGNPIKHVNVLPKSTFGSTVPYMYIGPMNRASKLAQVNGSEQYMESEHRYMEKRQWAAVVTFEMAINIHEANNNSAAQVAAETHRASLIRGLKATA